MTFSGIYLFSKSTSQYISNISQDIALQLSDKISIFRCVTNTRPSYLSKSAYQCLVCCVDKFAEAINSIKELDVLFVEHR